MAKFDVSRNGHEATLHGSTLDDQIICSCGWKSAAYWDGAEFAYSDWKKHVDAIEANPSPNPEAK